MKARSIKFTCMLFCFLWIGLQLGASPYTPWLRGFERDLDVGHTLDNEEKGLLIDALKIKPEGSRGDYRDWLRLFEELLDVKTSLDPIEETLLQFTMQAMPNNNADGYLLFMTLLQERLFDVGKSMDADEEKILQWILKAIPEKAGTRDYQNFELQWQRHYQDIKRDLEPLDELDNRLLSIFQLGKPRGRAAATPVMREIAGQDTVDALLSLSPAQIADILAQDSYQRGKRILEIIEVFHQQLKQDANTASSAYLDSLLDQLENLDS